VDTTGYRSTTALRQAAVHRFAEFVDMADSLPSMMTFRLEARDRNTRDLFGHLAAWHQMMVRWHTRALEGVETPMPTVTYRWDEVAELNMAIWRVVQELTLVGARAAAIRSHGKLLAVFDAATETQLWTPGLFTWTRGSTVGSWFETITAVHYEWAIAKLRRAIRAGRRDHGGSLLTGDGKTEVVAGLQTGSGGQRR
jgi:hypothetical protein